MKNLLLPFFLLLSSLVYGQKLAYKHYDVKAGLPQLQITCMLEDSVGNLWVGTKGGLALFDGKHFKSFEQEGLKGMLIHRITAYQGSIWVLTPLGIAEFRDQNLVAFYTIPFAENLASPYHRQTVFLPINRNEWVILMTKDRTNETTSYQRYNISENTLTPLPDISFADWNILGKVEDRKWLLHRQKFAKSYWYDPLTGEKEEVKLPKNTFLAHSHWGNATYFKTSRSQDKVFAARNYIDTIYSYFRMEGDTFEEIHTLDEREWDNFVSSDQTLYRVPNAQPYLTLVKKDGTSQTYDFPSIDVRGALEDRHGNIWFGTERGLYKIPPTRFRYFDEDHGLPNQSVWGINQDHTGQFWVGTYGGGLFCSTKEDKTLELEKISPETVSWGTSDKPKFLERFYHPIRKNEK